VSRENKEKYRKERKPGVKPKSSTQRGVECSSNDAGDGPRGEKERKRENGRRGKQNKNKQEKGNKEFAPLLTRWAGSMFDEEWESGVVMMTISHGGICEARYLRAQCEINFGTVSGYTTNLQRIYIYTR